MFNNQTDVIIGLVYTLKARYIPLYCLCRPSMFSGELI